MQLVKNLVSLKEMLSGLMLIKHLLTKCINFGLMSWMLMPFASSRFLLSYL